MMFHVEHEPATSVECRRAPSLWHAICAELRLLMFHVKQMAVTDNARLDCNAVCWLAWRGGT